MMMSGNEPREILEALDECLSQKHPSFPFVVFDYDNTLVENDLQQAFIAYMCRHQLIRDKTLMHDIHLSQDDAAYHNAFFLHYWNLLEHGVTGDAFSFLLRSLSGFRVDEIDALTEAVIREQGTELGVEKYLGITITKGFRLRNRVRELMLACVSRNIAPYVITASPEPLVRAAIRYYDIPAAGCVGINLEVRDRVFQNNLVEPIPVEEGKITCIRKCIHEERPLLGAGDTMNDYGMLNYSRIRVIVDRKNELSRLARENGWFIIQD